MKLRKGFITHTLQDTQIMVAAGQAGRIFQGIVYSNETAAFIVDCLKTETTEADIVIKLLENYEVDRNTVEKDVHEILEKLRNIQAIEE